MVGPKRTQTRVVGIITDKTHPYLIFKQQGVYENVWGCILSVIVPNTLVLYFLALSSPLTSLYLFVFVFNSMATE